MSDFEGGWGSVFDGGLVRLELICLLLFTCNYVVSVWGGFLFLRVLGVGCVILLWHSLSLPYSLGWAALFYCGTP